jgi:membrane-associated protease RseP (regulator of RpoE activity)
MSRTVGALGSFAVHAALVLALLPGKQAGGSDGVQAVARQQDGEEDFAMQLLPSPTGDGDGLACPAFYRGVGVVHGASYVLEIAPGSPAERAGLQVGDKWLNLDAFARDEFPIGTRLVFKIERYGVRLDLPVVTGVICYEVPR